jgi:oxygen-independent coproporphyrinogen-3 oxidase
LHTLGRIHNSKKSLEAVSLIKNAGYDNWSLDLIFAIPGQTIGSWENTLQIAIKQNPPHISAYGMTIEKGTPFEQMVDSGKLSMVDETTQVDMYKALLETMAANGYARYEISNFAKEGYQSRHNLKYWQDTPYLGLGPAAHSYNGSQRRANFKDVGKYIELLESGKLPIEFCEKLTAAQKGEERLMMGLRLAEGVLIADIIEAIDRQVLVQFLASGHLIVENNMLKLAEKGILVSDEIIVELLKTDS